jgi:hypothetical protein
MLEPPKPVGIPRLPGTNEYWEDNAALGIVVSALRRVYSTLKSMVEETAQIQKTIDKHGEIDYLKISNEDSKEYERYIDTYAHFIFLGFDVESDCRTAILMAAIDIESEVNRFLFFNIGEQTTNSVERLNVEAKLQVAHRVLGLSDFKGTRPHQAVIEIFKWRDRFAHGKIPGVPGRDLRSIHVTPRGYKQTGEELSDTVKLMEFHILLREHLSSIDKSRWGGILNNDIRDIRDLLPTLKKFKFTGLHAVVERGQARTKRG